MRFFNKKTMSLTVGVVVVFLLVSLAARDKIRFPFMERAVVVVLAPIEYLFSRVGLGVRQAGMFTGQIFSVYSENQRLKVENEQLRQDNINKIEITAENARLRTILNYKNSTPQFDFVVAKVIARDPGTWSSVMVINRGTADGIAKDMPVVTPQGLVGSIANAYEHVAKIQLILDARSAVGAIVQRPESRVAAIVEGYGSKPSTPRMVNIPRDADIIKGDRIITSGFGGVYPKGLNIGEVVDVVNEEGGLLKYAVLKPAVDFDRLEEVLVIVNSRQPIPAALTEPSVNPAQQAKGASQ